MDATLKELIEIAEELNIYNLIVDIRNRVIGIQLGGAEVTMTIEEGVRFLRDLAEMDR